MLICVGKQPCADENNNAETLESCSDLIGIGTIRQPTRTSHLRDAGPPPYCWKIGYNDNEWCADSREIGIYLGRDLNQEYPIS